MQNPGIWKQNRTIPSSIATRIFLQVIMFLLIIHFCVVVLLHSFPAADPLGLSGRGIIGRMPSVLRRLPGETAV